MNNEQRINISEQIAEDIKEKIINGEYKIKDKIPSEFSLCAMYNASRSTIRSALQILVTLGLIETRFGSGSYVKANKKISIITADDQNTLNDIYISRKLLEPNICKYICDSLASEDINEFVQICANIERNKDETKKMHEFIALFHRKLALMTKNNYIINIINQVYNDLESYSYHLSANIEVYYHKQIVKALLQRDGFAAQTVMTNYIDEFGEAIF